ncbi:MAG: hypothetical protein ACOC2M_00475 [bacterium]
MKNYIYIILLGLAAIMLFFNGYRIKRVRYDLEKGEQNYQLLKRDSEIFLNSLLNVNCVNDLSKILLVNGDTLMLNKVKSKSLYFFFPANECMSCVEQNVFALLDFSKENTELNVYIVAAKQQMRYIQVMYKSHRESNVIFGILLDEKPQFNSSFYFLSKEGEFTNVFYPQKGEFEATELYLKKIKKSLNPNAEI